MLFLLIRFKLNSVLFIYEINCNIFPLQNFMYVMCICLIFYGLGCDMDLLRSFVTLGRLPGLYKWKYMRANVLVGAAVLDLV
jgi:hypothetical protein